MDEQAPIQADNAEGAQPPAPTWRDNLDPTLKDDPTLTRFKDVNELSKSYLEVRKTIGENRMAIPKSDEDKDGWNQVYNKLGRPEKVEGYKLPELQYPKEIQYSKEEIGGFLSKAHELGLSQKQVEGMMKWNADLINEKYQQHSSRFVESAQENETSLRKEWGNAFQANISNAKKFVETFGDDAEKEFFLTEHGNDPRVIKFLAKAAKGLGEDKIRGISKPLTMTPDEAQQKIAQLKQHPALLDREHPEHKLVQAEWRRVHEAAYGG